MTGLMRVVCLRVWHRGRGLCHREMVTLLVLGLLLVPQGLRAQTLIWTAQGAAPNTRGQVENIRPDNEVVGAINALAPHPTNPNILYVGAVNGGIWRTGDAMADSPDWEMQTDDKESLAIGALAFDPTDPTHNTLVAGTGGFSSFGAGGAKIGLLRTTDGGATWQQVDGGGTLRGLNISGVAPRGNEIPDLLGCDDPVLCGIQPGQKALPLRGGDRPISIVVSGTAEHPTCHVATAAAVIATSAVA